MWGSIATLQVLKESEHLVPASGEKLPDVVLAHVVSKVTPGFLCSQMLHLRV